MSKIIRLFVTLSGCLCLFALLWPLTQVVEARPLHACQNNITVTSTADSGPGSLRQALVDLCDGGIITFAASLANQTITLTSAELSITKTVTITNPNAPNLAVSGNNAHRVFDIQSGAVVAISSLDIINGMTNGGGGGISVNSGATLTVDNSSFSGNQATSLGGGINNNYGTLTIRNSAFDDNSALAGAGVGNSGILTVTNSTFTKNIATSTSSEGGGGLRNIFGTVTVNESTFNNNSKSGIYNIYGQVTVNNSTFVGNSAYAGGGIYNRTNSSLTVNNSTFSNNSTTAYGGSIANEGTLTINSSTLNEHSAFVGGGIANWGTIHMQNSIVANSTGGAECWTYWGTIATNLNNLIEDGSCTATLSGDPKLGPLQDNGGSTLTYALLEGSPAIDQGSCNELTTDQRGVKRPIDILAISNSDDGCDIGAYEYSTNQAPLTPFNPVPVDGKTDVPTTQTLSWQSDDPDNDVVTCTIALGLNNPPSIVATTTQTSYTPSGLLPETTYYWFITASDEIHTRVGPIWSFITTVAPAAGTDKVYLPIVLK